jgi:hypothetical protein
LIFTNWTTAIRASSPQGLRYQNLIIGAHPDIPRPHSSFHITDYTTDYDPLPNVGGKVVGIDSARKWFDLAVDTSVYNYTTSLNQSVYAYIAYIPNLNHFNGSVDVYPPATNNRTMESPISYSNSTAWPVLRIQGGGSLFVGQYLWVRLSPTCAHALPFYPSGSLYATVPGPQPLFPLDSLPCFFETSPTIPGLSTGCGG